MRKVSIGSLSLFSCVASLFGQTRPNIVVFLVDDMGLMDTSVPFVVDQKGNPQHYPLNEWYRTPNMERLAKQGVRFSTFYAQSVSSPTRASIMTGQNSARHRTTNWIKPDSNNRDYFGPYDWNWDGLTTSDLIFPKLLSEVGYITIHVGKAHFGHTNSEGADPLNLGFDVNVAGAAFGGPGSYLGENGYGLIKGKKLHAVPDLDAYHNTKTHLTEALTIEAGKEIAKAVESGKPFYLNMAHYAVHTPHETDEQFIENYSKGDKNDKAKAFATLIEGMDKSLGDLIDKIEELGVAENTFIIFLGDNGGDAPLGEADDYGSSAPYKGKKGSKHEGGTLVPFIASWVKPNSHNSFQKDYPVAANCIQTQMGTVMDIFPTVLSVAGVNSPEDHILDGSDLKKLLQGKTDSNHRDDFLMHYPHQHRSSYFTTYRKGDWKLVYDYNSETDGVPTYHLFNLAKDPFEKNDLASKGTNVLHKMCTLMMARLNVEEALYPIDKNGNSLYPQMP